MRTLGRDLRYALRRLAEGAAWDDALTLSAGKRGRVLR